MSERLRGDRREARRIRDLDPMHQLMPYFLPKRCDSEVYMHERIDITDALQFIREKNQAGGETNLKLFHLILAALAKTVILRPCLNRFISGRRYYERCEVSLAFVVKKQFSDEGEESLMILKADGDMTLDQISRRVAGEVKEVRKSGGNDLDSLLRVLAKFPRPVLAFFAWILRRLEYHGKMPAFLAEMDPYYCTAFVANLGSIKIGAPYHHLTEYGTNSMFVTIGEVHKETVPDPDGNPVLRDILEIGVTLDERIADGYYFARSVRLLKFLLKHPDWLELPFNEEVNYDA